MKLYKQCVDIESMVNEMTSSAFWDTNGFSVYTTYYVYTTLELLRYVQPPRVEHEQNETISFLDHLFFVWVRHAPSRHQLNI